MRTYLNKVYIIKSSERNFYKKTVFFVTLLLLSNILENFFVPKGRLLILFYL